MRNPIDIRPIVDPSHPNSLGGSMTTSDESRKEVRSAKEGLLGSKNKIRIGAWNVRTMFETTKTAQVLSEMKRYRLDILQRQLRLPLPNSVQSGDQTYTAFKQRCSYTTAM